MIWLENIEAAIESIRTEHKAVVKRIIEKKNTLNDRRPLPMSALSRIKEDLYIEWSYNSNGIEGNTLNLNETRMVLQEGMTIKGKPLREHLEITNHHEAIEYVEELTRANSKITDKQILKIHEIVMTKIEKDFAGRYRNGNVRIAGANFVPPNHLKTSDLMSELIVFINENPFNFNVLEMAAIMHHRFVWIHPFFDGNGRTVRLLTNLYLMQHGYPPCIILKNDRKKYYDALNKANNNDYEKLMLLIMQAIERSLDIYLMAYPDGDEYMSITNILEEEQLPYGQEYISLLARTGKIDAYKEGRNWVTSKEAINTYLNNRKRKRKQNEA